jgi:hypothetical protein
MKFLDYCLREKNVCVDVCKFFYFLWIDIRKEKVRTIPKLQCVVCTYLHRRYGMYSVGQVQCGTTLNLLVFRHL